MSASYLRIYRGPEEETAAPALAKTAAGKPCVTVALSEVLPLLADAVNSATVRNVETVTGGASWQDSPTWHDSAAWASMRNVSPRRGLNSTS